LPQAKYSNDTLQLAAFNQLTTAIAATNGVSSVGATSVIPFGGSWSTGSFSVEGYQPPANTPGPWGDIRLVTPEFLSTIQAPLLHGRQFNNQDVSGSRAVAIVDEEMAKRYWPKEDPVGKRITFNELTDSSIAWIEVVGVVGHTSHEGLDAPARVQVYFPVTQVGTRSLDFAVRTPGDPMSLIPALKQSVHQVDADLPLSRLNSMSHLVELSTGPRRFSMLLLGVFSLLAVGLASLGLYGVMSYTVTQRAKELGVRLALGARTPDVLRLVLRQGMQLALIGIGVGLVAAIALTRLLKTMLFNVTATDPLTFIAISVLLVVVTLMATWFPARRATRVDPIIALRAE
jgi:putative ABC transport system permease protein